ncbi:malate dehydrogenase, mitochondrial isoform X1 [Halyomorpha halys]|uniref:malate dehydrogenase, mitochondrial isoform X1 n=2 Tax=Halyomorpha halys TaxID=286706 RepID=UPI0006D4D55D|nr:malate dehydrogenase, mitochondrial-like isoform X2 [Halyomorpha halys]
MLSGIYVTCKPMVMLSIQRLFSTSKRASVKVAVLGASGGIGQPLSLLLKLNSLVTELSLYDIKHTPGVAADLSHIDRNSVTKSSQGPKSLKVALTGMEVVVIPAGVPRKPGMTRDDLFTSNASIVRDLVDAVAKTCPKAIVAIVTNPVNSCVPVAAEMLKKHGVYNPRKLFGVTTLDLIRASTFIGNLKGLDPSTVSVPVIGGHSGETIVPVMSQCKPYVKLTDDEICSLTNRIQNAGTEVVKLKAGAGSATLAMAFAGSRMVDAIMRAFRGQSNVVECSFVAYDYNEEIRYFATPLLLGRNGIEKNLGVPKLTTLEKELLEEAIPTLKKNIQKGEKFVQSEFKEFQTCK